MKLELIKRSLVIVLFLALAQPALAQSGNASSAASSSSASDMIGMASSLGMAGIMAAQCNPPAHIMPCVLAALSLAQAALMMGEGGGAGDTAQQLAGTTIPGAGATPLPLPQTPGLNGAPPGAGLTNGGTSGGTAAAAYQQIGQSLLAQGVSLSPDGQNINLPNGQSIPISATSSPQAMQAAGLDTSNLAQLQAAAKAGLKDEIKKLGLDDSGAGGGGGGFGSRNVASTSNGAGQFRMQNKKPPGPASVAGMSKKLGDDNIGVAGDDIFQMVNRRYKARDEAHGFLSY